MMAGPSRVMVTTLLDHGNMTRFSRLAALGALFLFPALASAQTYGESPYIFGVHEPGGAPHMADKRKGWILFLQELGHDPGNVVGQDYRPWADQGYGMIVRLNHGYGTNGTLPYAKHYAVYAERVKRFVAASPGAHIWIVGNEMNWDQEWPRYEGFTEEITPERYVQAFRVVRDAIKSLAGHAGDQVVPGAIGTYGPPSAGGLSFVQYHVRVLELLGAGGLDAIAVHTYTHGTNPSLIFDEAHMGPPYEAYHYNFRAYRDYLGAHPAWARGLPVYVTETDPIDPWADANSGWVKNAYREINDWNDTPGAQKIRALVLYRFCPGCDRWDISNKGGVIADFREAMNNEYRWTGAGTACAASVAADHWLGEYFPNTTLSGAPTLVRDHDNAFLNLDWGVGGPNACGIGSDRFSARFTRTASSNAGTYRFSVTSDDGVRLYVDGQLKLDRWIERAPATDTVDVPLAAGNHTTVLEYYENGGGAVAKLSWSFLGGASEPLASDVLDADSAVPTTLAPGETRPVRIRVRNTGSTTWNAAELVRLGAGPDNNVTWSGFSCGGFSNSLSDARSYLCASVAPGASADFAFNVTAPASGPARLSVRMVKEGVAWFGEALVFPIAVVSNPCQSSVPADRWRGEYFANTTLSGTPAMVRDDGAFPLAFSWGLGGPNACGLGSDQFSARFTRTLTLAGGGYRFTARVDDGVRVWIDGVLQLDKWIVQAPTSYSFDVTLAPGAHVLKLEYFENAGEAVAQLSWQDSVADPCQASVAADRFRGEYFTNTTLTGAPAMVRDDGAGPLSFDWGAGGPASCGIGTDRFSVRWTRSVSLEAGTWRFSVTGDDGVRLFVDGALKLDKWIEQAPTTYWVDVPLGGGPHLVRLEYFEAGGGAAARLSWAKPAAFGSAALLLGHHVLSTGAWQDALNAGAKSLTLMNNVSTAYELAKRPDLFVMHRVYFNAAITPEQFLSMQGVGLNGTNLEDRRVIRGMNESDVPGYDSSPAQIRARAHWDRRVLELMAGAVPNARYAGGGYAHGNPDFTNPDVNRAIREEYAPLYNGNDPANPRFLFTMHNYTYGSADPALVRWFEGRYVWLFTDCGFDPRIRAIVSDETGIEAGAGGFRWAGYDDERFRAWANFYLDAVGAPIVVGGTSYPSPLIASTLFQLGDRDTASGHWGGYEVGDYLDVLSELYRTR
jgi:hypothetical protein